MDVIGSCILGSKKFSSLYAYLGQHISLEREEQEGIQELLQVLIERKDFEEVSKLLSYLISTNFDFNKLKTDIFEVLELKGQGAVLKQILIHIIQNNQTPKEALIQFYVKSIIKHPEELPKFIAELKGYSDVYLWKPLVEQLIAEEAFTLCVPVLSKMPIGNVSLLMIWEHFIRECIDKDKGDLVKEALLAYSVVSTYPYNLSKLTNYYVEMTIKIDGHSFLNILKSTQFLCESASPKESTLEEALLCLANLEGQDERIFINAVKTISKSITARVLNNVNSKLIELGRESLALSLFNLGLNRAFPLVSQEELSFPPKLMKRLAILQQQKISALQNELNKIIAEQAHAEEQKLKAESKLQKEKMKDITKIKKYPEKMEDKKDQDDDWNEFVMI